MPDGMIYWKYSSTVTEVQKYSCTRSAKEKYLHWNNAHEISFIKNIKKNWCEILLMQNSL